MDTLSSRQQRAIAALLTSRSITEAASVAQVGLRTLQRWLTDEGFRQALRQAEGDAIDAATRRLVGLNGAAIDTLSGVMTSPDSPAGVRVRASLAILDTEIRLRELRNIEDRLARLEGLIESTDRTPAEGAGDEGESNGANP